MPNWCSNSLTICGSLATLQKFKSENAVPDNPESLSFARTVPESIQLGNIHWRQENWGTKWDIDNSLLSISLTEGEIDELSYDFDTAWSPPISWVLACSRYYPDLKFKLVYSEPGCDFAGIFMTEPPHPFKIDHQQWSISEKLEDDLKQAYSEFIKGKAEFDPEQFYSEEDKEYFFDPTEDSFDDEITTQLHDKLSYSIDNFDFTYLEKDDFLNHFMTWYIGYLDGYIQKQLAVPLPPHKRARHQSPQSSE